MIVTLGSIGRLQGPIIGTVVFFALRKAFTDLGTIDLLMLGAAKIAVMPKAPNGIWGLVAGRFGRQLSPWSGSFNFRSN